MSAPLRKIYCPCPVDRKEKKYDISSHHDFRRYICIECYAIFRRTQWSEIGLKNLEALIKK